MSATTEMLQFIFQNSEMGKNTLKELEGICQDPEFDEVLKRQYDEYVHFNDEAKKLLEARQESPKGIGTLQNMGTSMMLKINTLADKYPSHLSEMLIQGSTMGVIDVRKNLNHYRDASQEAIALGKALLEFEEKAIEEFKTYL